jgi:YkoY family integral membrane protein
MVEHFIDLSPNFSVDTFFLLLILVGLEAVLSADNAIALASIAQGLTDPKLQRQALNFGLIAAFVLRMLLILTATWVIKFWQFELIGALYLLWLVWEYFSSEQEENDDGTTQHKHNFTTLWQVIPLIAMTDLAFSLDSVTTAIAVSDKTWLILTGGAIGIIALRFLAGLFIRWLDEFVHLEDAGYITVALVGLRLLLRVVNNDWAPPQWLMVSAIILIFAWGFSQRTEHQDPQLEETSDTNS